MIISQNSPQKHFHHVQNHMYKMESLKKNMNNGLQGSYKVFEHTIQASSQSKFWAYLEKWV